MTDLAVGQVQGARIAYRERGTVNLHPVDGVLTCPTIGTPHGLRRLVAIKSARGLFDGAVEAIERGTGHRFLRASNVIRMERSRSSSVPPSMSPQANSSSKPGT